MATRWSLHDAPPPSPPFAGASAPAPLVHPASSARRHPPPPSLAALAGASSSSAAALAGASSSSADALPGSSSSAAAATIPPPGSSISAAVEWKMADKLCGMLEVFSKATKVLSGSKYPTMSCYFHQIWEVKRMLQRESANPDMVIKTMIQDMKAKFQKYWDLSYLKICIPVFLDPRFKLSFLEFRLTKGFEGGDRYFSKVEKYVRKLFAEYSSMVVRPAIENIDAVNNEDRNGAESNPWADWGQHQRSQQLRKISELDRYLEEEIMPVDVELDILQHWKMHSTRYPILSCMARDLLAVPASSVASESAFSTGERVISDYRSRLTSETVEALICLQDWIRENDTNHDHIAGNTIGDDEDNI
ncbi:hypothetical protein ACP70R_038587 [Stipagrostis hirtigluma subsp. patula]